MTAVAVASETVQFASDHTIIPAFLVEPIRPARPRGSPAVIILHEWWGLTDHIKHLARRFADAGFVAFAPDLYARLGSKATSDPAEAARLLNALASQWVLRDLNAGTTWLKEQRGVDPLAVGIVGFSMGGTFALTQATHNSDLKAAVAFYGKVPPLETLEYLLCPVLYHYPAQDAWVTKQEVELLRQGREKFGKPIEVCVYPEAAHGFFNDTRPDGYRAQDAAAAWQRTLHFLKA